MKKAVLAAVAAAAILGSNAVYAQNRPQPPRMSTEDRAAFLDARMASIKAGLQLTADQEKLWPPVETALRDFAKQRAAERDARISERDARRAERRQQAASDNAQPAVRTPPDPVARLRSQADGMTATAAGLKKIADATEPLYKTLNDSQKRRFSALTRLGGGGDWFGRGFERDRGGDRADRNRGRHHRGWRGDRG